MSVAMRRLVLAVFGWLGCGVCCASVGNDVAAVFARAERGEPLRYVAIGGSITQASGDGWAGGWLRERFPKSDVTVVNSGMSATGSSLGVFRIERDIIAHQPDLVAIEYCVNDGGLTDEDAVRYLETMVVRLKSLPHPPAIIMVEAAAKGGVNLARHRRVARHYGLIEVDMQAAMDAQGAAAWETYFSDNVHPNQAGHALYAQTMRGVLAPLTERARVGVTTEQAELPAPLSAKPLLLDARLVPLQGYAAPGWKSEASLPAWWNRFFQGVLGADEPGAVLRVPFRGTTVGVFYAMNTDHGSFYASVDGGTPRHVITNTRGGYGSIILGADLPAREHVLTLVLPAKSETDARLNGPVKLGYLLLAGEAGAGREASPQGAFSAEVMRDLVFVDVAASAWSWTGPFPAGTGIDARGALFTKFMPEPGDADFSTNAGGWKPVTGDGATVDVRALSGDDTPTVAYARTAFGAGEGGEAILSVTVDYYAQLWLNGERALVFDGPHPRPHFMPVKLKPGVNEFFIKTAAGSAGHGFELRVATLY
ncbi:MAG: SGNH/GDSL hydrolase family protein [Verrucomicrobiota bacterium]